MIRRGVVVDGLVQGVFFRESCRREAVRRGVTGWVRNRPDGTVEAQFEGTPDAVGDLVAWARRGPEQAVVRSVETAELDPVGDTSFSVR